MATTYTDATAGRVTAWPLQGRTDDTGSEVTDEHFDGKDAGLLLAVFTEGILAADSFQVVENDPAGMSVVVGSGAVGDTAVLHGTDSGLQPSYGVKWTDGTTDVTIGASDASNPRLDEVYLVVEDDQYDSSGRVLPRLAVRDGTPASEPDPPGPDGAWTAYLLLATVTVGAGVTEILDDDIADERVRAVVSDDGVGTASLQDAAVSSSKIADDAVGPSKLDAFLRGAAIVEGFIGISSTLTTLGDFDVVIDIPNSWNTWDCAVEGHVVIRQFEDSTSVGGNPGLIFQVRISGEDPEFATTRLTHHTFGGANGLVGANVTVPIHSFRSGITTTGNHVVARLRASRGTYDNAFDVRNGIMIATAFRLT